MNEDDSIAMLMSISNCSADRARHVLEKSRWDLNRATNFLLSESSQPPPDVYCHPQRKSTRESSQDYFKRGSQIPDFFPRLSGIPSMIPEPVPVNRENIVLQNNMKFKNAKEIAKRSNQWLLVMLLEHMPRIDPFIQDSVVDLFQTKFHGLMLSVDNPEGVWFKNTYEITICPGMAVIDPVTGLLVDKQYALFTVNLRQYLEEFLCANPQKGLSLQAEAEIKFLQESEMKKAIEESLKTKQKEDERHKEEEEQEVEIGEPITMMVQLPNGKRSKISIGSDSKVMLLYKKISELSEIDMDKFELKVSFPPLTLDDKKKSIKECNLKGCLLNLIEN